MVVGFTSCELDSHSWWGVLDTTLCDKVYQWLVAGLWFSPGTLVSSTTKTDRHDITEILLKVTLNIITLHANPFYLIYCFEMNTPWIQQWIHHEYSNEYTMNTAMNTPWIQQWIQQWIHHEYSNEYTMNTAMNTPWIQLNVGWVRWFMVFYSTFNNISVISWRSVLLVEETGVHGENHRPVASQWQTLSYNVVLSTPRHEGGLNSQI
jgi:hypothetical protein